MKKITAFLIASVLCISSYSQDAVADKIQKQINAEKTDNNKSILTSLYRAALDNVLGDDKKFSFSSNFYGLDSIFRKKGERTPGKNEKFLRQNSLNFGLVGDSSNNIKEVSLGFTFSIINKKDIKLTEFNKNEKIRLNNYALLMKDIRRSLLTRWITLEGENSQGASKMLASWNAGDDKDDYSLLDDSSKAMLKTAAITDVLAAYDPNDIKIALDALGKGENPFRSVFKSIAAAYVRKPLWTFSPSYLYDRSAEQSTYSFATAFTAGIGKASSEKPWEIEANASYKVLNDSTIHKTNYLNRPFSVSLGINKVLLQNKDDESKMEFKFFTRFDSQTGKMAVADKNVFTLNTTLRFNVYKSLWLPVTLKYDPDHHNFLGVFSITANLGD